MEQWLYLIALLVSIAGLVVIDYRLKLAFWRDAKRTAITVGIGMVIFILWDYFGIALGIFFHGESQYALPYRIFPEFPIEELFFLFLLCYTALLLYLGLKQWRRIS
jgi:lycopene cyclase domain-containing protein